VCGEETSWLFPVPLSGAPCHRWPVSLGLVPFSILRCKLFYPAVSMEKGGVEQGNLRATRCYIVCIPWYRRKSQDRTELLGPSALYISAVAETHNSRELTNALGGRGDETTEERSQGTHGPPPSATGGGRVRFPRATGQ
jgi:hypothetical protein